MAQRSAQMRTPPPEQELKRKRSPTGLTPRCKRPTARRQLSKTYGTKWSVDDKLALVNFVLLYGDGTKWLYSKKASIWEAASKFVLDFCGSHRTSGACRTMVTARMSREFASPKDAEASLKALLEADQNNPPDSDHEVSSPQDSPDSVHIASPSSSHGPSTSPEEIQPVVQPPVSESFSPIPVHSVDRLLEPMRNLEIIDPEQQVTFLGELFSKAAERVGVDVPRDFLPLSLNAMRHLADSGRSNVVYDLCQGLGTFREDGSDSVFPAKRLICGLVEYSAKFFNAGEAQNVPCPDDYRTWCESMYTLFGNKWINLHGGPMWKVEITEQEGPTILSQGSRSKVAARVNIPTLSASTMRRMIQSSEYTIGSEIQVATLDTACNVLPGAMWWIKSDGVDVVSGLMESAKRVWNGDVDLGDGVVQKRHADYIQRLQQVEDLVAVERAQQTLSSLLSTVQSHVNDDIVFVDSALRNAQSTYEEKLSAPGTTDRVMFGLGWKIDELSRLNQQARKLMVDITVAQEYLEDESKGVRDINRHLSHIRDPLKDFIKAITWHRRTPATHVLVTLISPSYRNRKPYALPVCCLAYSGLSEATARTHISAVIKEMQKRDMKVEGFVSNGEYNNFRVKGYTRPLSVIQLMLNARRKYSQMGVKNMRAMLIPQVLPNGTVVAEMANAAVSSSTIRDMSVWMQGGASFEEAINRLRLKCVPPGYIPTSWTRGEKEDLNDKLRSILSQLEFVHQVTLWEEKGVPFKKHFYVPEVHPLTSAEFHEREDDAHVLKRIATSTRLGGPEQLKLERFGETLEDPTSGLTYQALTGKNKQSVRDAERLFSKSMLQFMNAKGYKFEAKYIEVVYNWRRASDERGLKDEERSKFNHEMLQYLKDELVPWHKDYDLSKLEVNRITMKVRGMTRETLIALTTTIESREWVRRRNRAMNLPPEHPRASTTDDVECFFSILRNMIGMHFTVKDVRLAWRKVCIELRKRLDRNLPFYYYVTKHERFFEGDRPTFEVFKKPKHNPRHQPIRKKDQPGQLVPSRSSLVQSGQRSIRRTYFNVPIELPPPPTPTLHSDHTYSR